MVSTDYRSFLKNYRAPKIKGAILWKFFGDGDTVNQSPRRCNND